MIRMILQQSERDCLFACYAMMLSTFGVDRQPWQLVSDATVFNADGISAAELRRLASDYGLLLHARHGEVSDVWNVLVSGRQPAIVHWRPHHYVVVIGTRRRNRLRVYDPAVGRYEVGPDEFAERASGAVFTFSVDDQDVLNERASVVPGRLSLLRALRAMGLRSGLYIALAYLFAQFNALGISWAIREFVDRDVGQRAMIPLMLVAIGLSVMEVSLRVRGTVQGAKSFDERYSSALFKGLLTKPLAYFERNGRGALMERLNLRFTIRDSLLASAVPQVVSATSSVVVLLYIAFIDSRLAICVTLLSGVFIAINQFLVARQNAANVAYILRQQEFGQLVQRDLSNVPDMISMGLSRRASGMWNDVNSKLTDSYIRVVQTTGYSQGLSGAYSLIMSCGLALYSAGQFRGGDISLGTLLLIQVAGGLITSGLKDVIGLSVTLNQVRQNVDRHTELFDAGRPQYFVDRSADSGSLVEVNGLSMRYGAVCAVDGVSLTINPGSKTFIVGQSGSGKSTLLRGLMAIQEHEGSVSLRRDLRGGLGVAFADARVGGESVRDILDPRRGGISDRRAWAILDAVALKDRVSEFPLGLDSFVSEDGGNLSNGERKRLALARAIASGKSLVVLDEPFTGLDSHTVRDVYARITGKFGSTAYVIVTHDVELIKGDDRVVFVSGSGRVVISRHASLLSSDSEYRAFIESTYS